ncbi:MAG: NUDIX hydrolase, partial [Candidatus Competibacter sp.]
MKFCSQCGASVTLRVPVGDNLPRYVCDACDTIHYLNPKVVAGCILEWQDRVLLCRRAIEPRYGLWTLPAGFMENGESTLAAAAREALEEAHAEGENLRLYGVYSLLHVSQVY